MFLFLPSRLARVLATFRARLSLIRLVAILASWVRRKITRLVRALVRLLPPRARLRGMRLRLRVRR